MNPLEGDKKPLHDVPWGTGKGQVEAILRELDRQNFAGPVIIEYEYNWENNLEEVKACADFFSECIAKR